MTERTASIDDLLGQEEEEPAARPSRRRLPAGRWISTGLTAAGLTAVTVVGLLLVSIEASIPAIFAGWLALLLVRRATAQVAPPPPPRPTYARRGAGSADDDGMYDWDALDSLRGVIGRWENKLIWSQAESGRFAQGVHPDLGELVDERLRHRHGLTRASEPDRARALLGEPLWKFLTTPTKRPPAPRDLAAIVAQLEKL